MKKSKKEHIESYIFTPSLLSKEKKREIERWLESDEELRAVADWYASFKKEIEFVEKSKTKVRPESSEIQLFPSVSVKKKKHSFTLAAQSTNFKKKKKGFYNLRTFVSEENRALVRILRNLDEGKVQLHAISENIEPDDIIMLRIPGITDLMISKPGGVFSLNSNRLSDEEVMNWDSCTLYLSLDRADLLFNPETCSVYLDTHRTDKEKFSLSIKEEESCVSVHLKTDKNYRVGKVVVSDGEKGFLLIAENDVVYIPRSVIKNRLMSLFFFN